MQLQIEIQQEQIKALQNTIIELELTISQQNSTIAEYRDEIQQLSEKIEYYERKREYKSRSKEEAFEVMSLYNKGCNISKIAEQLRMDRKTVRAALNTAGIVIETKRGRPKTKMGKK